MTEDDAALEKHLGQVAQGQAVAQPPQHYECNDVGGILGVVQQPTAALVVLLAAAPAAEPAIALGGALGRPVTAAEPQATQSIPSPRSPVPAAYQPRSSRPNGPS